MAKNQLLDQLFALFKEKPFWSVKDLRLRTEQPESYLKEVLPEIAMQHKSGSVSIGSDISFKKMLIFRSAKWALGIVAKLQGRSTYGRPKCYEC